MLTDLSNDVLPSKRNESVYVIPCKQSKYFEELTSSIPGGLINVRELNDVDFTSNVCVCVWGKLHWMIGAKEDCIEDLDKDPFVFSLKDFQNSCQVKVTVTGKATKGFPNPSRSHICIIGAKTNVNNDFETQSEDVPVSLLIDDSTKGCVVLIDRWLYTRYIRQSPAEVVRSLMFILQSTPEERRRKQRKRILGGGQGSERPSKSRCQVNKAVPDGSEGSATKSPIGTPTKTGRKAPVYTYTQLSDLKPEQKVNVAGIVKSFKQPCRSRGKDFFLSFTIIDRSRPNSQVNVIAFNSNEDKLPSVNRVGNIILLRHAKVNTFNDALQIVSLHFTSHHVFSSDSTVPLSSTPNATLSSEDILVVKTLQEWVSKDDKLCSNRRLKKLEVVEPKDRFDFVGLLCDVNVLVKNKLASIAVTDGTFPTFNTADSSLQCSVDNNEYYKKYHSLIVTISVYDYFTIDGLSKLSPGAFIYFQNVEATPAKNIVNTSDSVDCIQLCVSKDNHTSFAVLPETDRSVLEVKEALDSYVNPEMPLYYSIVDGVTYHCHKDSPFTTVSDVIANGTIPYKYRLDVRPVMIHETCVENVSKLFCKHCLAVYELPQTQEEQDSGSFPTAGDLCDSIECTHEIQDPDESPHTLSYMFFFTLTIADDTGELDVTVLGKHALMLMLQTKPCNLYLERESRDRVLRMFVTLFGYDPFDMNLRSTTRPTTRMDCGVFSFYQHGTPLLYEDKLKATVLFRLFDTILIPEENDVIEIPDSD